MLSYPGSCAAAGRRGAGRVRRQEIDHLVRARPSCAAVKWGSLVSASCWLAVGPPCLGDNGLLSIPRPLACVHGQSRVYWLAILTTFATGTAAGDLIAEKFSLGYLTTLGLFAVIIAIIAALWKSTPVSGVLAFWLAYIMTRPLGASTGDWLSQQGNQGLNLGTTTTSYLFLGTIIALVVYLQIRKPDVTPVQLVNADAVHHPNLPHPHHDASGDLEPSES